MSEEIFEPGIVPVLPVYWIAAAPDHIGYWCPWCSRHHVHGALGGDGLRVSHYHDKRSPLYGEMIDLIFAGRVRDYTALPMMTPLQLIVLSNFAARDNETPRYVVRYWWKP